ncbi:unnamed protein product, partial [Laminaria digitata]
LKIPSLILAGLLAAAPLQGQAQSFDEKDWDVRLNLLTHSVLSPLLKGKEPALTAPPVPGSTEDQMDRAAAMEVFNVEVDKETEGYIQSAAGYDISWSLVNAGMLPDTSEAEAFWSLLEDAYLDVSLISLKQKKSFARLRQEHVFEDMTPRVPSPSTPAYPSLVAADISLFLGAVTQLTDSCSVENAELGARLTQARIISGVSTSADIEAGRALGDWYLTHL